HLPVRLCDHGRDGQRRPVHHPQRTFGRGLPRRPARLPRPRPVMKRLLASAVVAACAVLSAPLGASAIAPATEVTLLVTDCKTGNPISAGTAYFILPNAVGVAPINAGVVGPNGLGDGNYRLIVTSPGYREADLIIHAIASRPRSATIPICLHPVAG